MPYRYEQDIAIADVAFEARGRSVEELFIAAADATTNVMIENLNTVEPSEEVQFHVSAPALDLLLWSFLQELIYFKDARKLLLRIKILSIRREEDALHCRATAAGEPIDPKRHRLCVDVKAVTMHRLSVYERDGEWIATVVLDV